MSGLQDERGPQPRSLGEVKPRLEEEQQMTTNQYSFNGRTFPNASGFGRVAGCLGYGLTSLGLQLLSLIILVGLLVAVLSQGSKLLGSQSQSEQELYEKLTQLKTAVDRLCQPCSWDWMSFQENCYFFSKVKRNWRDSMRACLDVEAQLVVIETDEEQSFLQQASKNRGQAWMGLSDLNEEARWQWVNGLPLLESFQKYWNKGEPNNVDEEDCVEFLGDGWNDAKCENRNFWICKKPSSPCSSQD